MKKIIVNEKYNNKKLSNFIFASFPLLNKNVFFKALRKKDIRINNVKISNDIEVNSGDEITIYINDNLLYGISNLKIDVIYEDDNIIVFNKPEGISVTENSSNEYTLTALVKQKHGQNLEPCHRLDRNTKGLVIYAKNAASLEILLEKFKSREIEKHYITKVYGIPKKDHNILEAYLFKDSKKNIVYISDTPKKDYSKIITEYSILKKNTTENTCYLDINLHTGKTHQIRAHLAHIGFPIIGDGKYGINKINKKFNLKTQFLYSYKIKFNFKSESGILTYLNNNTISLNLNKIM